MKKECIRAKKTQNPHLQGHVLRKHFAECLVPHQPARKFGLSTGEWKPILLAFPCRGFPHLSFSLSSPHPLHHLYLKKINAYQKSVLILNCEN